MESNSITFTKVNYVDSLSISVSNGIVITEFLVMWAYCWDLMGTGSVSCIEETISKQDSCAFGSTIILLLCAFQGYLSLRHRIYDVVVQKGNCKLDKIYLFRGLVRWLRMETYLLQSLRTWVHFLEYTWSRE